ncbi:MAG TPA: hypothetical protein PLB89_08155 [Flavobacteriales bacterium]|nr:hypothetical protein [Flavobacteriales bacterium]
MRTFATTLALSLVMAASAQNYSDLVELVRSDLRTEKQAIVLSSLQLTEPQSALFMPIYDEYNTAMKSHWDKKIQLIKDYGAKYQTMNDETAASLMGRMNKLEAEGAKIRTTYTKKVAKVLPTTIAARWNQVERRIAMLIDLQIADEVPLMPTK